MSFKEDIDNYKTLVDTDQLYYKTVPYELWKELGAFISKCIDEENYGEILRGLSNVSLISTSSLMGDFDYFVDALQASQELEKRNIAIWENIVA